MVTYQWEYHVGMDYRGSERKLVYVHQSFAWNRWKATGNFLMYRQPAKITQRLVIVAVRPWPTNSSCMQHAVAVPDANQLLDA